MPFYKVTWEIELDAETAAEAAERARDYIIAPDSLAHVFAVQDPDTTQTVEVDLNFIEDTTE